MAPTIGTHEEFSHLVRSSWLQAIFAGCLLFGSYTAIVLFTIYTTVSKKGWKKAFYRSMLTMMLVIYAFTFLFLTAECYRVQSAFVDHGQTDESIFIRLTWNGVRWNRICRQISWAAVMFLSDCVMIWRCWSLWNHSLFVIAFPVLLVLGQIVTSLLSTVLIEVKSIYLNELGARIIVGSAALSLVTTVLVTLLIVYRIVRLGGGRRYRAVIGIIAESSALYSVALIIYFAFVLSPTVSDIVPRMVLTQVAGIASALIIARVSLGHARPEEENQVVELSLSTLRFGSALPVDSLDKDLEATGMFTRGQTESPHTTLPGNETDKKEEIGLQINLLPTPPETFSGSVSSVSFVESSKAQ